MFPDLIKCKLSALKVEKVVSPPQKPTIANKYNSDRALSFLIANPNNIPTIKQPRKLTIKVGHGKLYLGCEKVRLIT